jgi:hypothetical protein
VLVPFSDLDALEGSRCTSLVRCGLVKGRSADESQDAVMASDVFEHIPNYRDVKFTVSR